MADQNAIKAMTPYEIIGGLKAGIALAYNDLECEINPSARLKELYFICCAALQNEPDPPKS